MKYCYIDDRTKRENIVAEMRINLRNIHNKYCQVQDLSGAETAIDLLAYGKNGNKNVDEIINPFVEIAVLLEGMEETYEDSTDEEFFEAMEKLVNVMKEEMERV